MTFNPARTLTAALLASALPVAALAEAWDGLVIGTPGAGADTAFADSFYAATALAVLGVTGAEMVRDADAGAILAAIDKRRGQPNVILYYAGPLGTAADGSAQLMGKGPEILPELGLGGILSALSAGGTTSAVVLIEDCSGGAGQPGKVNLPSIPAGMSVQLVATSGPTGSCAPGAPRLTDAMKDRAGGLPSVQDLTAGFWTGSAIADPVFLSPAPIAGATALASDIAIIDVDAPMTVVASNDIVSVADPVSTVSARETVTPAALSAQELSVVDDGVAIFVAPPASQLAALPLAEGLPQPSIIIGLIESSEASFGTVDDAAPTDVSSNEISFDNLDARRSLRAENPDLFKTLVENGAFDPPTQPKALETALQTELLRMKCYGSTVDGIWGNGSRASVQRYFDQIPNVQPTGLDPTVELFRQIIVQDEIECPPPPAPVAQAAPRPSSNSSGSSRPAATTATRPAPQPTRPAAPAAPAPAAPSGGLAGANLGGVFR